MFKLTTLTKKKQVTIPADIVRKLNLKPGDKVMVEQKGKMIKLFPIEEKTFLDLFGAVKSSKKPDFRKLRKSFIEDVAKKALKN